ncbi:TetR/AcrR family transcriptional regulator [Dactylosporangium siamense]|nr:TetR/AcrR family transcriptional regulator [Dactylosporangium siamense]
MGRWEPDAKGRLMVAALELYTERGYEQTTVADIAQRAGVTERTFFRHFADKREVLFDGAGTLQETVVTAIATSAAQTAIEMVGTAMERAAEMMQERRDFARQRAAAIAANPSLQERELLKLAVLGAAAASALRDRGVPEPAATLAAEVGVTVFKVAFERWIDDQPDFPACIRATLEGLRALQ